ncbi:ABC transporter ATP-binding protein [Pseudoduganella sp.]|uniref:ABC transporter ATP-binding protein n=1 Tax=Pseudoduganella sp. TaxID=1880898 RepID=UPI0035AF47F4
MPILDLQQISYAFGSHTVVDRLSLQLAAGSIACLLGPSGCGKTTVLRCIAGFEQVAQGSIALDGEIVARQGLHIAPEQRRVGMVFQDYALFPHLTVAENIGFGLARAERAARVASLLQTVGLAGQGGRYPHELSGGQQQRVALARALAPRPRLLLLDEPFSNLDVELRERLAQEVRQILRAEGVSAILVTHDQHEAFAFADQVAVMHEGRIQQWDTPYNLYHRPANRFVADFVGQGVFLPGEVQADGRIRMELGILPAQGERGAPGQPMQVLLRPDDVLHDDASPLTAEVVGKTFRGAEFLYTLRLASGAQVLSLVPSHHNHALGERIGIVLGAEHVVAFDTGAP